MKYVDEFRDGERARALCHAITEAADPARQYRLMEFCGGHTHAVFRYGVPDLLPEKVELIHGFTIKCAVDSDVVGDVGDGHIKSPTA